MEITSPRTVESAVFFPPKTRSTRSLIDSGGDKEVIRRGGQLIEVEKKSNKSSNLSEKAKEEIAFSSQLALAFEQEMKKSKGVTQMSDELSQLKRRYTELKLVEKIKIANWKELSEKSSLNKEDELE